MNTLREAVGEYLEMRRGLGFKLREAGKGLIDFVTFLEQHNASYITQAVGARLGPATIQRSPGVLGCKAEFRARIRTLSQCH